VRSLIRSRSNSAKTANILNTIFPAAVLVSIRSDSDTKSAPALSSFSAMESASLVERARRLRLKTTKAPFSLQTVPSASCSPGRFAAFEPEIASE
jgi:hypothetical protein